MNIGVNKILESYKGVRVGVFVDEANLFYSQKNAGWRIDWNRFLVFCRQQFDIKFAKYYLGMPLEKEAYDKNVLTKDRIKKSGFEIIEKPLKKIYLDSAKNKFKYKCNFDVEITCEVIRNLNQIDAVLLVSSDSDFIGLKKDVIMNGKRVVFVCFERNVAWEIHKSHHIFFEDIRDKVEYLKYWENNKSPEN